MTNLEIKRLNKVPEVTFWFWAMKIMATTTGETDADYLIFNLNFGLPLTSLLVFALLCIALFVQLKSKFYRPTYYWISIVLISVFGTLVTDMMTDTAHIDLAISSAIFTIILVSIFIHWIRNEQTVSIHEINTLKREKFYWSAIFATFALGTALGDWLSEALKFGYINSAFFFFGLIAVIYAAFKVKKIDEDLAFWIAYILTRPFGASLGDYLSQDKLNGGLDFGVDKVSIAFGAILICSILYLEIANFIGNAKFRKSMNNKGKTHE